MMMTCLTIFVHNLEIPKLQALEKEELEGEITLEECKEVFKTFSSGKSSAEDGFSWEFYSCRFFALLSDDLINCYNAAYREGESQYLSAEVLLISYRRRIQIYIAWQIGGRLLY